MSKVLVIDDESGIRDSLSLILEIEGYEVDSAENAFSGLKLINEGKDYDFIICDVKMPGMNGTEFLEEIGDRDIQPIVIMISAYGTVETSLEAIKRGAADYINKPINTEELILRMRMAEERVRLRRENASLRKELRKEKGFKKIVYASERMENVILHAKKASEYKATVLISGESGTGKELIARAVHASSERKERAFVALNCAALPESLIESELFGYTKGAFSGAHADKRGLFEEADGGTLFLDEIGEFPYNLQSKLLRALQEKEIRRLGSTKTSKVNVRVIAATSRNLERDVREGDFRDDLFYRLNVLPIHIPSLRERKEDIPYLVDHFIEKYNRKLDRAVKTVEPDVMQSLFEYPWYGNVRELENVIERAIILTDSDFIDKVDFGTLNRDSDSDFELWLHTLSFDEAKRKLEKEFIEKALSDTGGNRTKAAELLGISRRSLHYKLKDFEELEE